MQPTWISPHHCAEIKYCCMRNGCQTDLDQCRTLLRLCKEYSIDGDQGLSKVCRIWPQKIVLSGATCRMNDGVKGEAQMTDFKDMMTIKNIVHYNKLLQEETDPDKCRALRRLFENEMAKRLASAKSTEIAKTRIS